MATKKKAAPPFKDAGKIIIQRRFMNEALPKEWKGWHTLAIQECPEDALASKDAAKAYCIRKSNRVAQYRAATSYIDVFFTA